VPGCEAPISIGTPSRAMRGFFGVSASDIGRPSGTEQGDFRVVPTP
jgi:hypothetical protein